MKIHKWKMALDTCALCHLSVITLANYCGKIKGVNYWWKRERINVHIKHLTSVLPVAASFWDPPHLNSFQKTPGSYCHINIAVPVGIDALTWCWAFRSCSSTGVKDPFICVQRKCKYNFFWGLKRDTFFGVMLKDHRWHTFFLIFCVILRVTSN